MNHILILCFDYPPYKTVGAQRPNHWKLFFESQGIEVTVVSRNDFDDHQETLKADSPSLLQVIRRKIRSALSLYFAYFLPVYDQKRQLLKTAFEVCATNSPDIIVATAEPFILFKYANTLSKKFDIPWIADYRDNWSNEPTLDYSYLHALLYRQYFSAIEKRMVSTASYITTVGIPTAQRIQQIFPQKDIALIPNGHAIPTNFKSSLVSKSRIKISYFGRLYKHRNPSLFILGVKKWISENSDSDLKIYFYGLGDFKEQADYLLELFDGVEDKVVITESLSYMDLVSAASDSNAFLMLSDRNLPLTNGKVFDYLGLKRPILLCPNDHSVFNELLTNQSCGYIADSVEDVVRILDEFWEHIGQDEYFTTPVLRQEYSRDKSSEELLNLIKEVCAES
ncbi:glycosyltransferase [Cryomorphaceae bacterium 1068]|nr:glycosyltransferase [Cryomorphaceae bacterium 1068]